MFLVAGAILGFNYFYFKRSNYCSASGEGFLEIVKNTDSYYKFVIHSYLCKLEGYNLILSNLKLPNKSGRFTSIDLVMICESGIYVFDSKNLDGWIYGAERNEIWSGHINGSGVLNFPNPIWENAKRIDCIKPIVDLRQDVFYKSYIVFSKNSILRNVNVRSDNVGVFSIEETLSTVCCDMENATRLFTKADIDDIYVKLSKYSASEPSLSKFSEKNIQKACLNR